MNVRIALCASLGVLLASGCRTPTAFRHWPRGESPQTVGRLVAENFVARKLDFEANPAHKYVIYPEACAWYGALTFSQLTRSDNLRRELIAKFEPLLTRQSWRVSMESHVDYRVFGIVPLEIYIQAGDPACLLLGKGLADAQWERTTPDGITTEARYWIDDMYMITALQVQAYRATGESNYLDRAARTMTAYLDRLQQPNGLFLHAPDAPFYWSRGNGWVAAGLTEILASLPQNHPDRARILAAYQRMMAALLECQGADGLWRQLLDHPDAWPESSGTAMFTFALVSGVKHGWLDRKTYAPAARKAWLGLVNLIDAQGNVRNVCEGTPKGFRAQYYLDRGRRIGDLHGQAPILWAASAFLR